jgi:hypothetical protein
LRQKNIQASRQAPPPDLWRDYRSALDGYERALRGLSYRDLPLPSAPFRSFGLPAQSLPVNQIETLLHIDDKPHGYQLIEPAALPVFPSPPLQPPADQPLPLWRRIFWAPPKTIGSRPRATRAKRKLRRRRAALQALAGDLGEGARPRPSCGSEVVPASMLAFVRELQDRRDTPPDVLLPPEWQAETITGALLGPGVAEQLRAAFKSGRMLSVRAR